jgi:hypothetical protein
VRAAEGISTRGMPLFYRSSGCQHPKVASVLASTNLDMMIFDRGLDEKRIRNVGGDQGGK